MTLRRAPVATEEAARFGVDRRHAPYRVGMVSLKPGVGAERAASYPGVDEYGVIGSPVIEPGEI